MGIGCGAANLNRIVSNRSLNDIAGIFKNSMVGPMRYHLNYGDALNTGLDQINPLAFLGAGGGRQGTGLMSNLTAATGAPGQQSFGRLFNTLPKAFKF